MVAVSSSPTRRPHGPANIPAAILLAAGGLLLPATAMSQVTVAGQVTDGATGQALGGVIVMLVDEEGEEADRSLSGPDGGYRLEAPDPGIWRLEARMLGYEREVSEPFQVERAMVELDLALTSDPIDLDPVDVRAAADQRCEPLDEAEGRLLVELWSEARAALDVVALAEAGQRYRFHQEKREQALNIFTGEIADRDRSVTRSGQPYRSVPADELLEEGWVQPAPGSGQTFDYYAPDAEVVLSDEFQESYCFGVRDDPRRSGAVGLTFEPVETGRRPDIEGVLWVSAEDAAPLELEYVYTHHLQEPPIPQPLHRFFGGEVSFRRLEDGLWVVDQWAIRMPQYRTRALPDRRWDRRTRLVEPFSEVAHRLPDRWVQTAEPARFSVWEESGTVLEVEER